MPSKSDFRRAARIREEARSSFALKINRAKADALKENLDAQSGVYKDVAEKNLKDAKNRVQLKNAFKNNPKLYGQTFEQAQKEGLIDLSKPRKGKPGFFLKQQTR